MSKEAFVKLIIEWNQGSPHSENVIPGIKWCGEYNIRYGTEDMWLAIEEYCNKNIIAARYEKIEADGIVWDTDYVMNFTEMKLAIRLDRSYMKNASDFDSAFSAPHFITLLIEKGYLLDDYDLPISRVPIVLKEDNIDILPNIISGKVNYNLPVIYISKTYNDKEPVNAKRIAAQLKGIAHVLIQEGTWLNVRLKNLCKSQNEYYGAIGIYYPNHALQHKRYIFRAYEGFEQKMTEKIIRSVLQYNNLQMMDTLYTWQGVSNALLRDKLTSSSTELVKQRQVADEANQLIESVDEDIQKLKQEVAELTRVNEALSYENQGLRTKMSLSDAVPILYLGEEDEFFSDEIKEILLKAIENELGRVPEKSRRADVLRDILSHNACEHTIETRIEKLKSLFKGHENITNIVKQELKNLGFIISDEGKHYKIVYYGDSRYWATIAKTPSDGRSGKNTVSDIVKIMM